MPNFKRRVEHFQRGRPITARQLSQLSTAINDEAKIEAPRDVPADLTVRQSQPLRVIIEAINVDTLFCRDPDIGQPLEERVGYQVAKPYLLRGSLSSHDGATFTQKTEQTRTATLDADGTTEEQTIIPRYVAGDALFILATPDSGIRDYPNPGDTVDWIDLNTDGRMWAVDEASQ